MSLFKPPAAQQPVNAELECEHQVTCSCSSQAAAAIKQGWRDTDALLPPTNDANWPPSFLLSEQFWAERLLNEDLLLNSVERIHKSYSSRGPAVLWKDAALHRFSWGAACGDWTWLSQKVGMNLRKVAIFSSWVPVASTGIHK